jgi:hypothetical protein
LAPGAILEEHGEHVAFSVMNPASRTLQVSDKKLYDNFGQTTLPFYHIWCCLTQELKALAGDLKYTYSAIFVEG